VDVRSFLADHPPFDALSDAELDRVVSSVQIEHFAPGTVIPTRPEPPRRTCSSSGGARPRSWTTAG